MKTLIVDNSIYTSILKGGKWVARYIRGETDIVPGTKGITGIKPENYARIILTGSETSISRSAPWVDQQIVLIQKALHKDIPLLGICFGHQLIARACGFSNYTRKAPYPEFGWFPIRLTAKDELFEGIESSFSQFLTHFDEVIGPPPGITSLAHSPDCSIQALRVNGKPAWGVQFHPEINIRSGKRILLFIMTRYPYLAPKIIRTLANQTDSNISDRLFANFQEIS